MLFKKDPKRNSASVPVMIFSLCSLFSLQANADQADVFIAEVMESRGILGLQLAVVKQGKTVKLANYGSTYPNAQKDVTQDSLFPINSMTKAFTGVLIVQLQGMNKLELSDPIGKHLDNLPVAWQVISRDQHPAVSASGGNAVTLIIYPREAMSIVVLTNVLGSLPIEFVDTIADFYR